MASNRFYIPNADEFFEARLLSLLQQRRDCLHENSDGGHAEFLARRLEEYQRYIELGSRIKKINLLRIWSV